jgi:hypothetical protein
MDDALQQSDMARGPWSTGLATLIALGPLIVGVTLAIAIQGRSQLGPLTADQIVYWVIVPLGALYPTVAAIARRMAYAPMTVLVVAAVAPSLVYATRLLLDPVPKDAAGHAAISANVVLQRSLPPALLAAAAFVAIELASAAMRRGVAVGVLGALAAAGILGAAFYASTLVVSMNLVP